MAKSAEESSLDFLHEIPHRDDLLNRMLAAVPGMSRQHADAALAMTWDKDKHQTDKEDWYRLAMEWAETYPDEDAEED